MPSIWTVTEINTNKNDITTENPPQKKSTSQS